MRLVGNEMEIEEECIHSKLFPENIFHFLASLMHEYNTILA